LLDDVGEEGEDENNIGPPKVMAGGGEGIERQRTISFQEQQRLHDILSSGRSNKRAVNDTSRMSKNNHNINNNLDNDDDGYIHDVDINSDEGGGGERGSIQQLLQPDAIYEERYGDAYVDQSIKYLYPEGYQSMRPRSGPWRLSVLIFIIFACLNIFVVGHCYDRGVRDYYNNNSGSSGGGMVDDEYLQDVDDDSLLMETRWCGSRPLYFMWLVSVWITVSSSSYCCIIGYVKMRDFVVANGRSQPTGMGGWGNIGKGGGRSDYYYLDSGFVGEKDRKFGSGGRGRSSGYGVTASIPQAAYAAVAPSTVGSDTGTTTTTTSAYSSYQGSGGRYVQSIYQSDGTPQFWGGHIYRPTQAAVAMTNRP
jgi:hypothetical protein